MGELVDGVWRTGWYDPDDKGAFQRPVTRFRNQPLATAIERGRYHLYASYACPWAQRTLITRSLRGLTVAIGVTIVDPRMGDDGWAFRSEDPDPIAGASYLREIYTRADARYSGRVTVPVLWDRAANTIVNNESREVMRMLDVAFSPLAVEPLVETLAPPHQVAEIEHVLDAIYAPVNNGVYRAGFAGKQGAYDRAVGELFAALAHWDDILGARRFTCGDTITEADVALFTTLLRFDLVYYSHFKCNIRRLRDHTNLWRFTRELYKHPGIRPTCELEHIKTHYYWSQPTVNPTRIIAAGPNDYAADLAH